MTCRGARSRAPHGRRRGRGAGDRARLGVRASGRPQWAPGLTFTLSLAGLLGIGFVVLSSVFEPRDLIAQGVLETYECIFHPRPRRRLCKPHLVLDHLQRLKHSVLVAAGEGEGGGMIWNRHRRRIRHPSGPNRSESAVTARS